MLLGVLGTVAISLANSVATDMLVAQQEQLNGNEATFEVDVKLPESGSTGAAFFGDLVRSLGTGARSVILETSTPVAIASDQQHLDNQRSATLSVDWYLGDIAAAQRLPVLHGSLPPNACYPGSIALNEAAAQSISSRVGATIWLGTANSSTIRRSVVGGIVADGRTEPTGYGSWSTLMCALPKAEQGGDVGIRIVGSADRSSSYRQVMTDVASRRGVTLTGGLRRTDSVATVKEQVATLSQIFTWCAALLLIASGLGIASVGVASVTERSRELIVRRAFGARRIDVFAQVVAGSLAVGALVAAVAVAAAIAGSYWIVPLLIPTASSIATPQFPWQACLLGVVAALSTSLLGGILPAIRATRLSVAEALRD
jgi:putative ABC transport system permease protein